MSNLSLIKKFVLRRDKAPFHFTHFITSKCNAHCNHCFYWKDLNKKDELSLEEIEKVSKSMGKIYILLLTGGEPFLRKDLANIVEVYYKNNSVRNLLIPTNGFSSNIIEKICLDILKRCPKLSFSINISLDGLEKDHDKIRGVKGSFKNAVKTHEKLKKIKNKYKNFNVSFATTVTAYNQNKILKLYKYIKEELKGNMSLVLVRGSTKDPLAKKINIENYQKMYNLISNTDDYKDKKLSKNLLSYNALKRIIRYRMNKIRYNMEVNTYKNKKFITKCFACNLNAVMYENGDLFPCELLNMKIGNIKDYNYNFQKLWNSNKANSIRKYIKKSKCCCTHECYLMTNILFSPKYLLKILFNKL